MPHCDETTYLPTYLWLQTTYGSLLLVSYLIHVLNTMNRLNHILLGRKQNDHSANICLASLYLNCTPSTGHNDVRISRSNRCIIYVKHSLQGWKCWTDIVTPITMKPSRGREPLIEINNPALSKMQTDHCANWHFKGTYLPTYLWLHASEEVGT